MQKPAILALQDGTVFHGTAIGHHGQTFGELVFNTSMSGYQEIISDPSYAGQMITFTYPHIGNVGTNSVDVEAQQIWSKGVVLRAYSPFISNWRSELSLDDYLKQHHIVGINNIDTRALTHILREKGAQNACIMSGDVLDEATAIQVAKEAPSLSGLDLAKEVSVKDTYEWTQGTYDLEQQLFKPLANEQFHMVAYDFGVKHNILRLLVDRGCKITVIPAQTTAKDALSLNPDGIFLSNGPGDPAACHYAIEATKVFLEQKIPLFGICLGFQILGLASGAKALKMPFGHHGANHPVMCHQTNRVMITSQNHGFAIDETSLPDTLAVTHRSLFDNSLQGVSHTKAPAFGFQGHPEASPGPHDAEPLFDNFINAMKQHHA